MSAKQYQLADFEEVIEFFHRKGWTDGLPIVPPTPARVAQFLEAANRKPSDEIGYYELRNRPITAEKLAINAVMAGCLPEYMPVLIAIVEGMLGPDVYLHAANSSTGSIAFGFIVNGPIRKTLGMNWQGNVLGPGNRANSSIGRAIRLVQMNIMGSIPGAGNEHQPHGYPVLDRSTLGQPSKYTGYHIVENEEDFPTLTPTHVELGFDANDSTVTVFTVGGHFWLSSHADKTPDEWLDSLALYLVGTGRLITHGYGVLLIPPETARQFVDGGWTKADIRAALYERTRRSLAWVKSNGWKVGGRGESGGAILPGDEDTYLAITGSAKPDDFYVVICGGPAGNYPYFLWTYAAPLKAATRKIIVP